MFRKREERAARDATEKFLRETYRDGNFAVGGSAWSDAFANLHQFAMSPKPSAHSRVVDGQKLDYTSPSFWHLCCYVLYHWTLTRSTNDHYAEYFGSCLYRGQAQNWPMLPSKWRLDERQRAADFESLLAAFFVNEEPLEDGLEYFEGADQVHIAEAIGQHHGLPTNLLDFTFDPVVALHFAGRESQSEERLGTGILFRTLLKNIDTASNSPNPLQPRFELLPPSHAPRSYQQSGIFVDCGVLDESMIRYLVDATEQRSKSSDGKFAALKNAVSSELLRMCTTHSFKRTYPKIDGFDEVFGDEEMAYWTGTANRGNAFFGPLTQQIGRRWYYSSEVVQTGIDEIVKMANAESANLPNQAMLERMQSATDHMSRPKPEFGSAKFKRGFQYAEYLSLPLVLVSHAAFTWSEHEAGHEAKVVDTFVRANPRLFGACCFASENVKIFGLASYVEELGNVAPQAFEAARQSLTADEIELLRSLPILRDDDREINDGDIRIRPEDIANDADE